MNATGRASRAGKPAPDAVSGSAAHETTVARGCDTVGGRANLSEWADALATLAPAGDDATRIDQIRLLENIKAGCAAAQARVTAEFAASQRALNTPASDPNDHADPDGMRAGSGRTAGDAAGASGTGARGRARAQRRAKAQRLAHRSAAAQIALARRESPQRGGRYVGLADVLVHEMPSTLQALQAGVINEWRAMIIVRETACLTVEQRRRLDAEIADRLDGVGDARIEAMVKSIAYRMDPETATKRAARAVSDRRVSLRPKPDVMGSVGALIPLPWAVACYAALSKAADAYPSGDGRSHAQRMADEFFARITGTPVPARGDAGGVADVGTRGDPNGRVGGDDANPVAQSEDRDDDSVSEPVGSPDTDVTARPESHSEPVPAETVDERVPSGSVDDPVEAVRAAYRRATEGHDAPDRAGTGRSDDRRNSTGTGSGAESAPTAPEQTTTPGWPTGMGLEIGLVITDRTLFGGGDDPALLPGNIPIPAPLARKLIGDLPNSVKASIRRLYTRPDSGELLAMDARRRTFSPLMRQLLFTRDQDTCRTPWCNAPARHADHLRPFSEGGATSIANGQSLSEDCNYTRTAPGWRAARDENGSGAITITTPTGHRYRSAAPDLIPGHARTEEHARERMRSAHIRASPMDVRFRAESVVEYLLERTG